MVAEDTAAGTPSLLDSQNVFSDLSTPQENMHYAKEKMHCLGDLVQGPDDIFQ